MENYANPLRNAIFMNYLCSYMVETKRKRGFGVLLFWNLNRKLVHVDNGLHIKKNNFDWSKNNCDNTRANYCSQHKRWADKYQPRTNQKIQKYCNVLFGKISKIGEYIYTQLNIFFRGNFFLATQREAVKKFVARRPTAKGSVLPWISPFLKEGLQHLK